MSKARLAKLGLISFGLLCAAGLVLVLTPNKGLDKTDKDESDPSLRDKTTPIAIGKMDSKSIAESNLDRGEDKGSLFLVNLKSAPSKKIIISTSKNDAIKLKIPDDWEIKNVGNGAIWSPDIYRSKNIALTGGKYIVMFDDTDSYSGPSTLRLLSYDVEKEEFKYFIEQKPNNNEIPDKIYPNTLINSGDNSVSYLFIPGKNLIVNRDFPSDRNLFFASNDLTFVVKREIDLVTQSYKDYKIVLPDWKIDAPIDLVSFHRESREILISYNNPINDSYYKIVNNEVDMTKKVDVDLEVRNQYIDGYKLEYIAPQQGDKDLKATIKVVDEKNNEYYRMDIEPSFYSLGIVAATKDRILVSKKTTFVLPAPHFEIGYIDLKAKTYTAGIKTPMEKYIDDGSVTDIPEFTFFVVGAL